MITKEEKETILKTYKWIKVPKYIDDDTLSWEERYKRLNAHHIEETTFLIDKIRSIVSSLDNI
jgi:hypothetical protein